jgi:uncharacterized protein YktA (UPF0223 family)
MTFYFFGMFMETLVRLAQVIEAQDELAFRRVHDAFQFSLFAVFGVIVTFCLVTYGFQLLRFIAWQNLQALVIEIAEQSKPEERKMTWKSKVYKLLISNRTFSIVMVVALAILIPPNVVPYVVVIAYDSPRPFPAPEDVIGAVIGIVVLGMICVFWIYDWTVNRKDLCLPRKFFITKDRLFFRLDIVICIIAFICYVIGVLCSFFYTTTTEGIVLYVFCNVFYFLCWILLNHSIGAGICSLSILLRCCSKRQTSVVEQDNFLYCLYEPQGHDLLLDYAASEYSLENMYCWDKIQKYKQCKDLVQRKQCAKEIYDIYIKEDSVCEVNIVQSIKDQLLQAIDQEVLDQNTMNTLESAVQDNIMDTFKRFNKTSEYKQWKFVNQRKTRVLQQISL